jgi:hypothetical protein
MPPCLELTPDGRLLARQKTETPDGLREKVTDFTAQAHHRLDDTVIIQAGTRLSAVLELLMVNADLKEIYTRNWVHDYVARYEAIRCGEAGCRPNASMQTSRSQRCKPWCCRSIKRFGCRKVYSRR